MWMCITIGDTTVGGPSGVGYADGMAKHGTRGITYHLDGVKFIIGARFFDNRLKRCNESPVLRLVLREVNL